MTIDPGSIRVIRQHRSIGAEVRGVDLSQPLPASSFQTIYAALLEHKVIFFRDQKITAEDHLSFGRQFGALEQNPFRPELEGMPELQVIKNDKDHPVLSTDIWHADLTFRKYPTKFTIVRCLEIPAYGGDTMWADMCAAYEGLSATVRQFVTGLTAIHDFKNFRVLYGSDPAKREELHRLEDQFPNPSHPVVINHPETLQRVLFVNRQFTLRIDGMTDIESRNILEILYEQAKTPEYQFRLSWRPGTLAMWDNRLCQHYAVNDYHPYPRHMERVAVAGDTAPAFNPDARPVRDYAKIVRVHAFEGLH